MDKPEWLKRTMVWQWINSHELTNVLGVPVVTESESYLALAEYKAWRGHKNDTEALKEPYPRPEKGYEIWKKVMAYRKQQRVNQGPVVPQANTIEWKASWNDGNLKYIYGKDTLQIARFLPAIYFSTSTHTFMKMEMGRLALYFYVGKIIAFELDGVRTVMANDSKNQGTGIQLNKLEPDKKKRVPIKEFIHRLFEIFSESGLLTPDTMLEDLL